MTHEYLERNTDFENAPISLQV